MASRRRRKADRHGLPIELKTRRGDAERREESWNNSDFLVDNSKEVAGSGPEATEPGALWMVPIKRMAVCESK
jgi:hypothetical protein